jgi:hypothetical protein
MIADFQLPIANFNSVPGSPLKIGNWQSAIGNGEITAKYA